MVVSLLVTGADLSIRLVVTGCCAFQSSLGLHPLNVSLLPSMLNPQSCSHFILPYSP